MNNVPSLEVRLHGPLGRALELCVENRLKKVDYALLVRNFREHHDADGYWRGEFWGKVVRSAVCAWAGTGDAELKAILHATVADMLGVIAPDGCVSTYPEESQLQSWDIWGRKYVLVAMVAYYEMVEPLPEIPQFCARMLDHLTGQLKRAGLRFCDCGEHLGAAASSILTAVMGVWRITREERFLECAREIARSGCCSRGRSLFEAAAAGIPPRDIGNAKAYEITSCFYGLGELEAAEPDRTKFESVTRYAQMLIDRELFVTGNAGLVDRWGEYWGDGRYHQTSSVPKSLGETCIAATCLAFFKLLEERTGEELYAGHCEEILYNAILGAFTPDFSNCTHCNPTPLTGGGYKKEAAEQMALLNAQPPLPGHDCCRAQGPFGLALGPLFAVRPTERGLRFNLYENMSVRRSSGGAFEVTGDYPAGGRVEVRVTEPAALALELRVPAWSREPELIFRGERTRLTPGSVFALEEQFRSGESIALDFHSAATVIPAPDGSPFEAVKVGPLVMALEENGEPGHPVIAAVERHGQTLIDYASAGLRFVPENTLTVWFER